jgi:hypothetical protein
LKKDTRLARGLHLLAIKYIMPPLPGRLGKPYARDSIDLLASQSTGITLTI